MEVKRLLLAALFQHGAQWVQLRTDERNGRSAAAIRKLGAADLGLRQEDRNLMIGSAADSAASGNVRPV